jgi:hypothetical protein
MLDFQITDFWEWFAKHSDKLQSNNYDIDLLKQLDETISNWNLGWEIGPGVTKQSSLTISPNSNKELLNRTNEIINRAPNLENWEFYSCKQPKENWHKASLIDKKIEVDAIDWTYVLLKYPDNQIEILLQAANLKELDTETKELAVDLVLTNLLGEELKMQKIDFIEIVDASDSNKGVTELKYLPAHLNSTQNRA